MEKTFSAIIKYDSYCNDPSIIGVFSSFDEAVDHILQLTKNEYQNCSAEKKISIANNFKSYYSMYKQACVIMDRNGAPSWEDLECLMKTGLCSNYPYSVCLGIANNFKIDQIIIRVDEIVREVLQDFMTEKY